MLVLLQEVRTSSDPMAANSEMAKLLAACLAAATVEPSLVDSAAITTAVAAELREEVAGAGAGGGDLAGGRTGEEEEAQLDVEEVERNEVGLDLTSLLGTLRTQLMTTDYLESHPPDPNIFSAEPADNWEEEV